MLEVDVGQSSIRPINASVLSKKKGFGCQYLSLENTRYWPKMKYCVWTANLEPSLRDNLRLRDAERSVNQENVNMLYL
jgi:hypothetical protein